MNIVSMQLQKGTAGPMGQEVAGRQEPYGNIEETLLEFFTWHPLPGFQVLVELALLGSKQALLA